MGKVVSSSASDHLGNGVVASSAYWRGCNGVVCAWWCHHGGYNQQLHCVHLVVHVAKYQVVCVLMSLDSLKHLVKNYLQMDGTIFDTQSMVVGWAGGG